jgi:hypothetical protein
VELLKQHEELANDPRRVNFCEANLRSGPKYVIKKGKTPVLTPDKARLLLNSINVSDNSGLRDRAAAGAILPPRARGRRGKFSDPLPKCRRCRCRLLQRKEDPVTSRAIDTR